VVARVWIVAAVYNLPRFFERAVVVVDVMDSSSLNSTASPHLPVLPATTAGMIQHATVRRRHGSVGRREGLVYTPRAVR